MNEIINKDEKFIREIWTKDEAIKFFSKKGEKFKVELINDLPQDEKISIYKQGQWLDLCKGPHMPSTKYINISFSSMLVLSSMIFDRSICFATSLHFIITSNAFLSQSLVFISVIFSMLNIQPLHKG